MKEYLKPDLEYVKFKAEEIASLPDGNGGVSDNDFTDEDFE